MQLSKAASVTAQEPRESRFSTRTLNLAIALLVVGRCAWVFGALLRSPDLPLRLAQDDFYYYLKPAQNLAWFHQSTAFQHVLTNGYHPLYFALLACVSVFVRTLPGIFRFLWVLDTLSATAVFFLTRRLFARVGSLLLANALAVLMAALCLTQICDQMEVTLALPIGFAFLLAAFAEPEQLTPRRSALMGILGALTFLARLDAGLLVFFYLLGMLCSREYRAAFTPKNIGSFLATCLPLPSLYFWSNEHFFGTLLPISGIAKELRHGRVPSVLLPASFSGTTEALVNVAVITAVLGWTLRHYLHAREKVFLLAVVTTPFVFYGLEMVISDWPVWNWYFYILRFVAAGCGVLLCVVVSRSVLPSRYPRLKAIAQGRGLPAVLCCAALFKLFIANYNVDHWMVEIQHAAGILDQFADAHPGVYAMGDRAGMFQITTANPVLQAEGLVMNRAYLEHIRAQDDLRSVLASYGVNYYVAFVFKHNYRTELKDGCLHAMEPSIAGPSSLRMRSTFCETPVFQFSGFDGKYLVYRINSR